jgi:hypothetical protein
MIESTFERGGEGGSCKRCGQGERDGHAWQCCECQAILDSDDRGMPVAACHSVLRLRCAPKADTQPAPAMSDKERMKAHLDRMAGDIERAARFAYDAIAGDMKPLDLARQLLK